MSLRPAVPGEPQNRRHPFSRSYGANLPSSLARVTPTRLGLLTQGHLCRFSVRSRGLLPGSLFTDPRNRGNPPNGRPIPPSPGSRHDGTPRASAVGRSGSPAPPIPRRQEPGLRCREAYPRGTGMLTRFPFGGCELRPALGPANPQLTTVAGEPWPLRRRGFSPLFAVTTAGIFIRSGSTGPHGPASDPHRRPPTGSRANGPCPGVSAAGLVPAIFGAPRLGG